MTMRTPRVSTIAEVRRRLSRRSADVHTLQRQPMTGTPCEVPVPRKVSFMDANVEKIAQFPALCDALLHFSHRIAAYVSNTASGLRISRNRRNRDSGPCGADAGRREKRGERIVPEYDPVRPARKDVRQVRRKQRNQNPLSIFQTNARAPCILVAASISRKASISGATFSSSTMARIEAFIEGHACVP